MVHTLLYFQKLFQLIVKYIEIYRLIRFQEEQSMVTICMQEKFCKRELKSSWNLLTRLKKLMTSSNREQVSKFPKHYPQKCTEKENKDKLVRLISSPEVSIRSKILKSWTR